MSDRRIGDLLNEIQGLSPKKDPIRTIEVRGANVFSAVVKLLEYIDDNFDEELSEDLKKRFLNAAKTKEYVKFNRGIKRAKKLLMEKSNEKS